MENEIFYKIERNKYTLQELSDEFTTLIVLTKKNTFGLNLNYTEALLLWLYNNNREYQDRIKLYTRDDNNNITTPIKSKLNNDVEETKLAQSFSYISQHRIYDTLSLNFLIKKINLTDSVTI